MATAGVAVVGAGLAGSLLALALARRGVATTLVGAAAPSATALSYGGMAGRAIARQWQALERIHGPLGWRPSRLVLHGWPRPLNRLPPPLQALASAVVPLSRVDAPTLAAALPAALTAAGVARQDAAVQGLAPSGAGWELALKGGGALAASQVVLAAGAGCRGLWPDLPQRLRFSWAGVIVVAGAGNGGRGPESRGPGESAWLEQARLGRIVQARHWRRSELEATAAELRQERWIVDAGLAPWGEQVLLGQISLVGPDADPGRPPDPAAMEARLREGLAALDPQLAALAGDYRQVPVPFCSDGQPLAGPVEGAPPGLWVFSGFSGAFTAVPPLAETLADSLAACQGGSLAGPLTKKADRTNHGGASPL